MTTDFLKQFKAARRVSTPLIAIGTPDPAATIGLILKAFNGEAPAVIQWDIVRGLTPCNPQGQDAISLMSDSPDMENNPTEMLSKAVKLPAGTCLFMHASHRWLKEAGVAQACWNLRDLFKQDRRTLVLLAPAGGLQLPGELTQDVLSLDEPLPSLPELEGIVKEQHESAGLQAPAASALSKAVDALAGLAAFPAEQVTAMSLTPKGLDLEALWERKRGMIEQTPGLSVWRGGETFDGIGGCDNAKAFMLRVLAGAEPPRGIVFIDEIEKAFAGTGSDLSGTTTEMTGTMLSWMQDNEAKGAIFIGPPGAAKSAIAKATGNTAGVPTIAFDISGMKGSLVGESGANLRRSLKVVQAVTQGRALFIATCNSIGVLPPELRRRFTFGTFFFDLPSQDERDAIWKIYCKKFKVGGETPNDDSWTGAEIRNCCDLAYRLKCSLVEAATYIVPVAKSAADQIEKLRSQASGRFISASEPGIYRYEKTTPVTSGKGRRISMEA
jgi:hypothetical protein